MCAASPSLGDTARNTPIVVTATAQAGPTAQNGIGLLSPASFRVVAYDQGQGPGDIKVQTALTENAGSLVGLEDGINPRPGQTWRLWGTFGSDGVLQTSICSPSTLVVGGSAPHRRGRRAQDGAAQGVLRRRGAQRRAAHRQREARRAGGASGPCARDERPGARIEGEGARDGAGDPRCHDDHAQPAMVREGRAG